MLWLLPAERPIGRVDVDHNRQSRQIAAPRGMSNRLTVRLILQGTRPPAAFMRRTPLLTLWPWRPCFADIGRTESLPSIVIIDIGTSSLVLFSHGHVTQAMLASFPLPLVTVQLPAVEFATGDVLGYIGDPSPGNQVP